MLPPYRNKRTVELLWHGIWSYVLQHRMDVLIGCASLEGTDPDRLALPLSSQTLWSNLRPRGTVDRVSVDLGYTTGTKRWSVEVAVLQ